MVALIIIFGNFYTLLASLFLPLDSLLLALVNNGISDYFCLLHSLICVAGMTLAIPSGAGGEGCVAGLALVECSGSVAANVWDGMCLLGGRRGRNVRSEQQGSATSILRRESACSRGVLPRRLCMLLRFGREGPRAGISKPG